MTTTRNSTRPVITPRRGRPRKTDEDRLNDAFLDYALAQFMALGYRTTTMEGLARGFGAAKSTIYARFGSKAGLVRAVMARGVPLLLEPLNAVSTAQEQEPRAVLRAFGEVIQQYACDPSIRAMWHAVAEAHQELEDSYEITLAARHRILQPIAEYLALMHRTGRLDVDDPLEAAACFSELTSGGLARFLGGVQPVSERRAALDFALNLFYSGVAPDKPPSRVS